MYSTYSKGFKVFFIFFFFLYFTNVKIRKTYCLNKWKITKPTNAKDSLFLHNLDKSRKEYNRLHTKQKKKEFINYKEIQIKRINDYRKRCGSDRNNINYTTRDRYIYHENFLFVRNEVLPTLAKIENEKAKEKVKNSQAFMDINDYNSAFDRKTFLQFMIDLYNIFLKIDEIIIIHKKQFSPLMYMGPMILTNHLYEDILYLSSTVQDDEDITMSEYGREYVSHLENLGEENKFKFLAHAYSFYKNFHLAKEHLLNSICKYLNIIKKLKSSTYVPDVNNFEHCLNKLSRNWDRWEKDAFLSGLYDATDKMMILTKHFQKTKK